MRRELGGYHIAGDPADEPDLQVPPALLPLLAESPMDQVKDLIRAWSARDIAEIYLFGDCHTREQRKLFAEAITTAWADRHWPELAEVLEHWNPPPPPPIGPWEVVWISQAKATHYGITVEQGKAALKAQDHRCAICRREFKVPRDLKFDHDHKTGAFRGLLCGSCNTGLGIMKDSPAVLRSALAYLERTSFYGPEELPA